jgi:hypothetical protein
MSLISDLEENFKDDDVDDDDDEDILIDLILLSTLTPKTYRMNR